MTFSRSGVSFDPPPDRFERNGFDHIESYVSRLLVPSSGYKAVLISTLDGNCAVTLNVIEGEVSIGFSVGIPQESERESKIRSLFEDRGMIPSTDYLFENGGVPNSARNLEFVLHGDTAALTSLTKDVLGEIYGIGPSDPLEIRFFDK